MKTENIILGSLTILLLVIVIYSCMSKTKEKYADAFRASGLKVNQVHSFNSNLDPSNMNMRADPNTYGGFMRHGSHPTENPNLASIPVSGNLQLAQNKFSSQKEQEANKERFQYQPVNIDFASLATEMKDAPKSTGGYDARVYMSPKELLPTPDMRSANTKDPSDPTNFMYDRTLFAPLKRRNHNEVDHIRGDLDISPIKTGWFDIATIPSVDLAKGYVGYFTDIEQYQDLQDAVFERARDADSSKMSSFKSKMADDIVKPSLKFAVPRPFEAKDKDADPWYDDIAERNKRTYEI